MHLHQEMFRHGGESLVLFPNKVEFGFKPGRQRPEAESARLGCVNQFIESEEVSELFFGKHACIIREFKRTFESEPVETIACPSRDIICPGLVRTE